MARLTRNSYKRKIILFAVFVFISIALISTGFAAWVMSSNTQFDHEGNVSVGVVSDSSLKIEITNLEALEVFSFQFEPAKGDETGRVRIDSETKFSEALTFTIEGKISNYAVLKKDDGLTIKMVLPAGMQKAIDLGYIVAPECVAEDQVIAVTPDDKGGATFTYTLTFKWGSEFKGVNPSLYFDGHTLDEETGKIVDSVDKSGLDKEEYPDTKVKTILEDLRACVYNYYTELNEAVGTDARQAVITKHLGDALPKFSVTIKAVAN